MTFYRPSRGKKSLFRSIRLWGVMNLRHAEYIRSGASQSYNVLALGDRLVRSGMRSNHPPITLSQLRTAETWSVRMFAAADIGRCIVEEAVNHVCPLPHDMDFTRENALTSCVDLTFGQTSLPIRILLRPPRKSHGPSTSVFPTPSSSSLPESSIFPLPYPPHPLFPSSPKRTNWKKRSEDGSLIR